MSQPMSDETPDTNNTATPWQPTPEQISRSEIVYPKSLPPQAAPTYCVICDGHNGHLSGCPVVAANSYPISTEPACQECEDGIWHTKSSCPVVAANPSPVTPPKEWTNKKWDEHVKAGRLAIMERQEKEIEALKAREATLHHKLREIVKKGANGYLPRPMTVITQGVRPEYYFKSHMDENLEYYRALFVNIAALIPETEERSTK